MRCLFAGVLFFTIIFSVQAQDGIYGSFTLGQKIVSMDPLNDLLTDDMEYDIEFGSNYWLLGGEGHFILAKHFVIGGKGMVMWNEEDAKSPTLGDTTRTIKIVGGMGVAYLGYAFLAGSDKQIRLIPNVGFGASTFLLQSLDKYKGNDDIFDEVFQDDQRSVMTRLGFAIDLNLTFDWYIKVIELVKLIPGLGFGPLIHADIGYTLIPTNSEWVRDVNDAGFGNEPDLSFGGFYFNLGVGLGLSSSRK